MCDESENGPLWQTKKTSGQNQTNVKCVEYFIAIVGHFKAFSRG